MNQYIDHMNLQHLVADLVRIEQAGRLDELSDDVAYALGKYPEADLEHCTVGERLYIENMADVAHRLLGAPSEACLTATTNAVLTTREAVVREIIAGHIRELDGTTESTPTVEAPAAIERARKKVKA